MSMYPILSSSAKGWRVFASQASKDFQLLAFIVGVLCLFRGILLSVLSSQISDRDALRALSWYRMRNGTMIVAQP